MRNRKFSCYGPNNIYTISQHSNVEETFIAFYPLTGGRAIVLENIPSSCLKCLPNFISDRCFLKLEKIDQFNKFMHANPFLLLCDLDMVF